MDDEFSSDGAGGTGQVKVLPRALSLPHEQPQKDTGEDSGGSEHFPTTLSCALLDPTSIPVLLSCISLYPGIEGSLCGSKAGSTLCASQPRAPLDGCFPLRATP